MSSLPCSSRRSRTRGPHHPPRRRPLPVSLSPARIFSCRLVHLGGGRVAGAPGLPPRGRRSPLCLSTRRAASAEPWCFYAALRHARERGGCGRQGRQMSGEVTKLCAMHRRTAGSRCTLHTVQCFGNGNGPSASRGCAWRCDSRRKYVQHHGSASRAARVKKTLLIARGCCLEERECAASGRQRSRQGHW